jgi:hypothetical protein
MAIKSVLRAPIPDPMLRRIDDRLERFNEWREPRPFMGGVLLMIAGIIIGVVPLQFATELALIGGPEHVVGLIFATLVFINGAFALSRPDMSTMLGVTGIALSILSLFGALGGFFIGMLIGIIGGNLCIAWQNPNPEPTSSGTTTTGTSAEDVQFSWQGDQ